MTNLIETIRSAPAALGQRRGALLQLGAVVLTTLGTAGCAHYQPQPIHAERNAAELSARSLEDEGLKAFLARHLSSLNSEASPSIWNLEKLTLVAFYYHPDLDVARAQWAVARAGSVSAGQRPNPTLSVSPAYDTTTTIPSPWIVTAALDLPIETAGKRGYRLARADQLSEAARLNIASAAWRVRGQVRRALVDYHFATALEKLLQDQQNLQEESLVRMEQQFKAGAISAFELTSARIAANNTRLGVSDARQKAVEARAQLAEALGLPLAALDGANLKLEDAPDAPAEAALEKARQQALLNRSDILSALAEYAASETDLRLEIAKQYPDVHLNPGYEFDQGDNKWGLGLNVELPVLNQNQGAIAEAEAKRNEAAARFNALQARVLSEIERSVAAYQIARRKTADTDALLDQLKRQGKAAEAMVEAGQISKADLVTLQLQISVSSVTRLEALAKMRQTEGQLEEALQSPLGLAPELWQVSPRPVPATSAVLSR
jgi:outer membrane protein, heavy metal efflux system